MADRKVQLKRNNDNLYPKTVMENVYDVQPNGAKVPLVDIVNTLIDQDEDMDTRIGKFETGINVGTNKVVSAKTGYTIEADGAAKLKTARRITLTNGASGYADFDGTKNISIPVTNVSSEYIQEPARSAGTPTSMPLSDYTRANKLAFLPADQIIIENTTDGGATWSNAGVSDAIKMKIFSDVRQESIIIPLKNGVKNTDCAVRLTITGMKYNVPAGTPETGRYNYWNSKYVYDSERYVFISNLYMWLSSNSDGIHCKVECATGANPGTWITRFSTTNGGDTLRGWSGSNYLGLTSYASLGGSTDQTGNSWNWRITFRTCATDGSLDNSKLSLTNNTAVQSIMSINGYGSSIFRMPDENNMARTGHIYGWDYLKNATFPAAVTASKFVKEGGTSSQFLKANGDVDATAYQPRIDGSLVTATKSVNGAINEVKTKTDSNAAAILNLNTEVGKKLNSADLNAKMGAKSGICPLDPSGIISSQYLPGYVDDVMEIKNIISSKPSVKGLYYNSSTGKLEEYEDVAFPGVPELTGSETPESGKIYVNLTDNRVYRWSGSSMVEISKSLAIGETGSTAFSGSRGKLLYDWYLFQDSVGNYNKDKLNNLPTWVCGVGGGEADYSNVPFVLNAGATSATIDFRYVSLADGSDGMGNYSLTIPASSSTKAGLMTAAQYKKLDGVKEKLVYDFDKILDLANNTSGASAQAAWIPAGKTFPILPTMDNSMTYDFEFRGYYKVGHLVSLIDESNGEGYVYFTIMYNSYDGAYMLYAGVDVGASYYTEKTVKKLI